MNAGKKVGLYAAITVGLFFFALFINYAVGFWVGSAFIQNKVKATDGSVYTSGKVTTCFFATVIGLFQIG